MKKYDLIFLLVIFGFAAARNVIFIPAYDNLDTGYSKYYNDYVKTKSKLKNGWTLLKRDIDPEDPYKNLKDLQKSARFGIVCDVVSAKRNALFTKIKFVMRYVDLETGGVVFSEIKTGRALGFNHERRARRAARKAARRFFRDDPEIPENYEYNEKKVGFVMKPPAGFSKQTLGRGLEAVVANMIVKDKRFNMIERRILNQQLKEQELSLSGVINSGEDVDIGKLASIQYALRYEVAEIVYSKQHIYRDVYLHKTVIPAIFQVIDMETGETRFIEEFKYKGRMFGDEDSGAVTSLLLALVKGVANAKSLMSKRVKHNFKLPAKTLEQKLDRGKEEGFKSRRYKLYRRKDLHDPYTGEYIGYDLLRVGSVRLKDVEDHSAVASLRVDDRYTNNDGYYFRKRR